MLALDTTIDKDPLAILRVLETAEGDVAIPAECLPVLTGPARLRPKCVSCFFRAETQRRREGSTEYFAFPSPPKNLKSQISNLKSHDWAERTIAVALLLLLAPLLLLIALLILLCDGWPVLFWQERYGQDGKPFRIVKFRTMFRRAPELHAKLQESKGDESHLFKLSADPRVTRLGQFLRRWFIDELPQLWNIVRGDMRFIGPRPLPASDQSHYTHSCHRLRLQGKPGLTGLWQVSGRNARTFDEMCLLDVYYLRNRSLALDLLILCRTIAVPFQ